MVKGGKDPHFILIFRENVDIILNGLLCGTVTVTLIIAGGGATRRSNATFRRDSVSDNIVTATFLAHTTKTFIRLITDRSNSIKTI